MVDFRILASGEISFHAIGRRGSMTKAHLLTLMRASLLTVVFFGAAVTLPARAEDSAGVAIVHSGQPLAKIYVTGPLLSQGEIKTAMGRRGGGEAADVIKSAAILDLVYHLEEMSG